METKNFKAMVVTENQDGSFSRELTTKNMDELPEGEVVIKVMYSSLNYKDALSASGNKGVTKKYPHTPGIDAAGIVEHSRYSPLKAGDEVIVTGYDLGMNTSGGYSEYIRIPGSWIVKRPEKLSLKEAMVYGTAGFTAALSVQKMLDAGVTKDSGKILVTGASGGVGSIAVSILSKAGFKVSALNGLVDSNDYLLGLGAEEVVEIDEVNIENGRLLHKELYAGVIDTVGGNILSNAVKMAAYGGAVTTCGNAMSHKLDLNVYPFIIRGVSLLGIDSVNCPADYRVRIWEKLSHEWKLENLQKITSEIGFDDLDERIELILQGKQQGRAIVKIQ